MSYFVNLRGSGYGTVCDAFVLQGDGLAHPAALGSMPLESVPALVKGKAVLLVAHGFNVNYADGVSALGRLEAAIGPQTSEMIFGVLWPGDWVIPAINYPFAEGVAVQAGRRLAAFCNRWLSGAQSLSLASHSLGARVILEATAGLQRRANSLCITAGAIGADCLAAEYRNAAANSGAVVTLSSREDSTLAMAYPPGDLIAAILDHDHNPFEQALGREGPNRPFGPPVLARQIPDDQGYEHRDYLPPSDAGAAFPDTSPPANWPKSSDFIGRVYRQSPLPWPP